MAKFDRRTEEEKKVALELCRQNQKLKRSWRTISRKDYFGLIPAGTLSSIAKGNYFPDDPAERALLGVGPKLCSRCHQRITKPRKVKLWRRLEDLKPNELLWALNNRTDKF